MALASEAAAAEVDAALERALEGHVPQSQLLEAEERAEAQRQRAAHLEHQLEALQAQLSKEHAQVRTSRCSFSRLFP